MTSLKILCAARALVLLAALLPAGASADLESVTWHTCELHKALDRGRVLPWAFAWISRPIDYDAKNLFIYDCGITELNNGDFDNVPNVQSISLMENNIKYVNPAIFKAVPKLEDLDLENNKLSAAPVFDSNAALPNLVALRMSDNEISDLSNPLTFSGLKKIQCLYLGNNQIENIHRDIFQGLNYLELVHLMGNRLVYIPSGLFAKSSLTLTVSLEDNRIEYIASGAFRGSQLEHLYLEENKLTYLPENFVSEINDSHHISMFTTLKNPWQCACLLEYIAESKKLDFTAYNDGFSRYGQKYGGGVRPICTTMGTNKCNRLSEKEYRIRHSL